MEFQQTQAPRSLELQHKKPIAHAHTHRQHHTLLDFRNNFMSGAIGLSIAFMMTHPIDTWKTKQQTLARASGSTKQGLPGFRSLFTLESARQLSKGCVASVLGAGKRLIIAID